MDNSASSAGRGSLYSCGEGGMGYSSTVVGTVQCRRVQLVFEPDTKHCL
jgi:hypothetical protein